MGSCYYLGMQKRYQPCPPRSTSSLELAQTAVVIAGTERSSTRSAVLDAPTIMLETSGLDSEFRESSVILSDSKEDNTFDAHQQPPRKVLA
jgi:hypothetical protein